MSEPKASNTVLAHYLDMSNRVMADPALVDTELKELFAADAVVDVSGEPVKGLDAIAVFYRRFVASFTEMRHVWRTTTEADGVLRAEWAASLRSADGLIGVASGVERAKADKEGKMTFLVNEFTTPPTWVGSTS